MSQREKFLQEVSQTDEERWAQLTGELGVNAGDEDEGDADHPVERLHTKEKRTSSKTETKSGAASHKKKSQAGGPKGSGSSGAQGSQALGSSSSTTAPQQSQGARQRTLFDSTVNSAKNQRVDLDSFLKKYESTAQEDDDARLHSFDVTKFLRDDDEDADEGGFGVYGDGRDECEVTAGSFLATLTATAPQISHQGATPVAQQQHAKTEGPVNDVIVPLNDEIQPIVTQRPQDKPLKSKQQPHTQQQNPTAKDGGQNFLKREANTAPLEIVVADGEEKVEVKQEATYVAGGEGGVAHISSQPSMYWLDAKEQPCGYSVDPGSVFLFGKVLVNPAETRIAARVFESCCVRVNNIMRCVMLLPRDNSPVDEAIREVVEAMQRAKIFSFRVKVVDRHYAFEEANIPRERRKWIKLRFPAKDGHFPNRSSWRCIEAVVGANRSLLELFLVKRRLKGPSYLSFSGSLNAVPEDSRVSHCRHEYTIADPKQVTAVDGGLAPPLVAVSIQLHTQLDAASSNNEIHAISLVVSKGVAADGSAKAPPISQQLIGVRPFDKTTPLPIDLEKVCTSKGLPSVRKFSSEVQLLQWTTSMLREIDPDLLVGHNFFAYTLDVLLHRLSTFKVHNWSTVGRLEMRQMPKLQSGAGGTNESSMAEREVCVGRLVVDTYILAREYYKSTNYKLLNLAQQMKLQGIFGVVDESFSDVVPPLDKARMSNSEHVFDVLARCLNNSVLSLALANQLDVIPLTKRLCTLAGTLWNRSLSGSRAERIEYLLLHAFHQLKFVTPDKKSYEAIKAAKRGPEDDMDDGDDGGNNNSSRKKNAKYKGGMVLEPRSGLYTDYILLLDFNSLYPSLIQEFNVCFTTVKRVGGCTVWGEGEDPEGPSEVPPPEALICTECSAAGAPAPCIHKCVLPKVIKSLVDSRREVKKLMKFEKDPQNLAQLEIRQKALKLTANSMYGCLGFEYSRFYAQPLAELVTRQGRLALKNTVEIVPVVNPNLRVLYGDTDSVMIQTGVRDDIRVARDLAADIKARVNKTYRCLEIDIDGIFRSILLHKKKKYAAIHVVDWAGEGKILKKEVKGLDMVRRDWCPLSQRCCDDLLNHILSGAEGSEDVHDFIAGYMSLISNRVRAGNVFVLEDFVISKSLTKEPETYKGTSFPHATVALRMKERKEQVRVGDLIPYVICGADGEQGDGSSHAPLSSKAFHPEEVKREGKNIDVEWYLASQIYPPVLRICEHIQGFTASLLAAAMGLNIHIEEDEERGNTKDTRDGAHARELESFASMFKSPVLEECFPDAMPFDVPCPSCKLMTVVQPHVVMQEFYDSLPDVVRRTGIPPPSTFVHVYACRSCKHPLHPAYIANNLSMFIHKLFARFYASGGGLEEVRLLRTQMTYLRALFDDPHMPGTPPFLKLLYSHCALRCMQSEAGVRNLVVTKLQCATLVTLLNPFDPVLEVVQSMYERVDHLFVSLQHVLGDLGVPAWYKTKH